MQMDHYADQHISNHDPAGSQGENQPRDGGMGPADSVKLNAAP
jgi:hypothetical protein